MGVRKGHTSKKGGKIVSHGEFVVLRSKLVLLRNDLVVFLLRVFRKLSSSVMLGFTSTADDAIYRYALSHESM